MCCEYSCIRCVDTCIARVELFQKNAVSRPEAVARAIMMPTRSFIIVAVLLLPTATTAFATQNNPQLPRTAGNAIAGLSAVGAAAGVATAKAWPGAAASYMACSTASYCLRRGLLHRWPGAESSSLGAAEVLRRHLEYEADWHLPSTSPTLGRLTHFGHVLLWLFLFQPLYPLLELVLYPFDLAAFWFYYPRARGSGLIIDSRRRRRSGKRGNAAQVFRLDWHRFELNVGRAYPPPNTGRHPPSVACNLPHIDLPQNGVRHWPWRQHTDRLMPLLPKPSAEAAMGGPAAGLTQAARATRRAPPPRLCAEPAEEAAEEVAEKEEAAAPVAATETKIEALQRIFVGTEFGYQTAALTLAFVVFLGWSSTALNSEFWLTPF